jgi:hypothetical protein
MNVQHRDQGRETPKLIAAIMDVKTTAERDKIVELASPDFEYDRVDEGFDQSDRDQVRR